MKALFFTILSIFSFVSNAQKDKKNNPPKVIIPNGEIVTLDVLYGTILYQKSLSNNLNSFRYSKIGNPLQTIGLSLTYTVDATSTTHYYSTHFSYSQIIPQYFSINDSLPGKINGGIFSVNLLGYDLTAKSKFSSILIGGGFNTGRLRVSADDYRSLRNPYFAPALFLNPRFLIKRLAISIRAEYQFDVSQKRWKPVHFSRKGERFSLDNLSQSGLILNVCLGWKF